MAKVLKKIRGKFLAGLATLAPIAATIWILKILFHFLEGFSSPFIDKILPFHLPGLGLIVSVVLVFFLGIIVTNFLGKKIVQGGEYILNKIPIANTIYNTAKQITYALSGGSSRAFQKTVLIQYPRRGLWTLAFVTGESKDKSGKEYYHLFVPTTPNPTSGFMIIVPIEDARDANMSVEEGLKAIISGGMLAPKKNEISTSSD